MFSNDALPLVIGKTETMFGYDQDPLVTVYIPTYNRRGLLERAARSVLNQTYENIELIIVDDGSSDDTLTFLEKLSAEDQRVKYLQNEINSGACVSRNKAIAVAKGEFITGLDDDDYFLDFRVESFLKAWRASGDDVVALYSNVFRRTRKGTRKASPRIKSCSYGHLVYANWPGNQVFTKPELLKAIGGFDPDMPAWQDLDCWYRLLKSTKGTARNVSDYSYVLDLSHPHERISHSNIEKLERAWALFCNKNKLSGRERNISRLMLAHYGGFRPNIFHLMEKIVGMPKWHNLKHSLVIIYMSLFSSWK